MTVLDQYLPPKTVRSTTIKNSDAIKQPSNEDLDKILEEFKKHFIMALDELQMTEINNCIEEIIQIDTNLSKWFLQKAEVFE